MHRAMVYMNGKVEKCGTTTNKPCHFPPCSLPRRQGGHEPACTPLCLAGVQEFQGSRKPTAVNYKDADETASGQAADEEQIRGDQITCGHDAGTMRGIGGPGAAHETCAAGSMLSHGAGANPPAARVPQGDIAKQATGPNLRGRCPRCNGRPRLGGGFSYARGRGGPSRAPAWHGAKGQRDRQMRPRHQALPITTRELRGLQLPVTRTTSLMPARSGHDVRRRLREHQR